MKSVNGINWKENNIPERLILKNKQKYNISYLLSKIFLDKLISTKFSGLNDRRNWYMYTKFHGSALNGSEIINP